jgi:hypothetical protein
MNDAPEQDDRAADQRLDTLLDEGSRERPDRPAREQEAVPDLGHAHGPGDDDVEDEDRERRGAREVEGPDHDRERSQQPVPEQVGQPLADVAKDRRALGPLWPERTRDERQARGREPEAERAARERERHRGDDEDAAERRGPTNWFIVSSTA